MIVIKLNIVRLDHFVSLDHDHTTQWLSVFCTSRTPFFFFSVASKNAWRRTLDSKTQTKERKLVSFELLKFILGSAAEGNKTGTRKCTRNLWYPRNRISYDFMFLLKGFQKDGGLDSNQKETAIRRSFFGESRRTPPKQKGKKDRLIAG